jgi:hypothetical protein
LYFMVDLLKSLNHGLIILFRFDFWNFFKLLGPWERHLYLSTFSLHLIDFDFLVDRFASWFFETKLRESVIAFDVIQCFSVLEFFRAHEVWTVIAFLVRVCTCFDTPSKFIARFVRSTDFFMVSFSTPAFRVMFLVEAAFDPRSGAR